MADAVIAERPPRDGREWDAQCARCGSSVVYATCGWCGGDGWVVEDCDDPDHGCQRCGECSGAGWWAECCSDTAYCEAHPSPGREQQPRAVEWFVVGEPRGAAGGARDA